VHPGETWPVKLTSIRPVPQTETLVLLRTVPPTPSANRELLLAHDELAPPRMVERACVEPIVAKSAAQLPRATSTSAATRRRGSERHPNLMAAITPSGADAVNWFVSSVGSPY
jgi:hypothetical protein